MTDERRALRVPPRHSWVLLPLLGALLLALSACGGSAPPAGDGATGGGGASSGAPAATGDVIAVGEFGSMTGTTAAFGTSTDHGVQLAIDEINAAGGVLGKKIKVYLEDDQSKPEEVPAVVSKLIEQNKVVALLGEVASSRSLAAAPLAQRAKIPMISPSSTNPEVTKKGDYIFRMCYLDDFQGAAMARFAFNSLGKKKGAILQDVKNDYSVGLAKFFSDEFTKLGGTIVGNERYEEGNTDFRAQLTKIKSTQPEFIFVPGYYSEAAKIAKQARDLGITVPFIGGDGWESAKLFEIGGKSVDGSFYGNHYFAGDPSPEVANFVQKFKERYGEQPDSMAALGYDAAKLLADSIKRAGTTDGDALRKTLAETSGWQGVTGTMSFDENRNPVKPIVILEIKDGQLALKESMKP
jgi:branched-chain amino acid transport system substrate-binding protein